MKTYKQFIKEIFALIVEDRVDDAIASNPDIHPDVIKHYANNVDPSEKKSYLPWILQQHKQGHVSPENSDELKDSLHRFHANVGAKNSVIPGNQKNINNHSYESLVGLGKTLPVTTGGKTKLDYIKDEYRGKLNTSHDPDAEHKDSDAIVEHFAKHADPSKGKDHLRWLLDQYHDKKIKQGDAGEIHGTLSDFDKHKHLLEKTDSRDYGSVGEMRKAMDDDEVVGSTAKSRDEHLIDKGLDLIHNFNNGKTKVYHTKTKGASQAAYGAGKTRWCTATRDNEKNRFDYYSKDAPLHQIHIEGDPRSPYQLSGIFGMNELADVHNNHNKTPEQFAKEHPELIGSVLGEEHPAFANEEQKKQFGPKLLDKIKKGEYDYGDLEYAKRYGYLNDEHLKAGADTLLHEIKHGNDSNVPIAVGFGYLNDDHRKALSDHLLDKIKKGKASYGDMSAAKTYGYYTDEHKKALSDHFHVAADNLKDKINKGEHTDEDIRTAHIFNYLNDDHRKALSDILHDKIKKGKANYNDLSAAKNYEYLNDDHTKALSDQLLDKIKKGGDSYHDRYHAFNSAERYGYLNDDHRKAGADTLLHEIKHGNDRNVSIAATFGYLNDDHRKALSDNLLDKIKKGENKSWDIESAKQYGYLNKNHKAGLANQLFNKIQEGKHNSMDLVLAKQYGYLKQEHKDMASDHLDSNPTNDISELLNAKKAGYLKSNHLDNISKTKLDAFRSKGITSKKQFNDAKKLGYLTDQHIKAASDYLSDKIRNRKHTKKDIENAKKFGYYNDEHEKLLNQ